MVSMIFKLCIQINPVTQMTPIRVHDDCELDIFCKIVLLTVVNFGGVKRILSWRRCRGRGSVQFGCKYKLFVNL